MSSASGTSGEKERVARDGGSVGQDGGRIVSDSERVAQDSGRAFQNKERIIQEYVPGKQITLAHLIANPTAELKRKLGLGADDAQGGGAIGIFTITPSEAAIIAADVSTKSAAVRIGFVDRFSGSLVITGDVAAVEAALKAVLELLVGKMKFSPPEITRS